MILMDLFEEVLHLSVYGTVAGAGVWLLSLLIGRVRAPKWIALVLWGILAFRLVIPFSFSSKMSVYQIGDLDMRIENTLSLDRIYAEGAQNLLRKGSLLKIYIPRRLWLRHRTVHYGN